LPELIPGSNNTAGNSVGGGSNSIVMAVTAAVGVVVVAVDSSDNNDSRSIDMLIYQKNSVEHFPEDLYPYYNVWMRVNLNLGPMREDYENVYCATNRKVAGSIPEEVNF
jgi:hypothetical protein